MVGAKGHKSGRGILTANGRGFLQEGDRGSGDVLLGTQEWDFKPRNTLITRKGRGLGEGPKFSWNVAANPAGAAGNGRKSDGCNRVMRGATALTGNEILREDAKFS
jgi:hypothetical protein